MGNTVFETKFDDLKLVARGKVRDLYDLGDSFLMVATDRLSAFDVVMPDPIPEKGRVLTQISLFWFDIMKAVVDNHVITGDINEFPDVLKKYEDDLAGRSIIVKKLKPLPIECIVRGYITGSGWSSYKKDQTICGIKLPDGLVESEKLNEPIYTPSTKGELGEHDINISFDETIKLIGREDAEKVRDLSLSVFKKGMEVAEERGIIIADTKFEFGYTEDKEIVLIDEVLTPDSSRFWPKDNYQKGGSQKSFDKQYLRDHLLSIGFDKNPPGPKLPDEVIQKTSEKYLEALNLFS